MPRATLAISLQQDTHDIFQNVLNSCPNNTQLLCSSMQAQFKTWMLAQNFIDDITVTSERNHSFLKSVTCGRKRKSDSSKAVGYSSVRQYGTSCIDLYKQQRSLNMNANPHPRDCPALNVLFNSVRLDESKKRQENFEDRGIGTIQDGYSSVEELTKIANYFLSGNSSASSRF